MSLWFLQEGDDEDMDETDDKPLSSHPDADTAIIFVTGEGWFGSLASCRLYLPKGGLKPEPCPYANFRVSGQ